MDEYPRRQKPLGHCPLRAWRCPLFVFVPPLTAVLPSDVVFAIRMSHRVIGAVFVAVPIVSTSARNAATTRARLGTGFRAVHAKKTNFF